MTNRLHLVTALRGRVYFLSKGRLWFCTVCGVTKKAPIDVHMSEWCEAGWKFLETHVGCKLEEK